MGIVSYFHSTIYGNRPSDQQVDLRSLIWTNHEARHAMMNEGYEWAFTRPDQSLGGAIVVNFEKDIFKDAVSIRRVNQPDDFKRIQNVLIFRHAPVVVAARDDEPFGFDDVPGIRSELNRVYRLLRDVDKLRHLYLQLYYTMTIDSAMDDDARDNREVEIRSYLTASASNNVLGKVTSHFQLPTRFHYLGIMPVDEFTMLFGPPWPRPYPPIRDPSLTPEPQALLLKGRRTRPRKFLSSKW